jgi:tetratricopeptide (TPR) repeat protein
LKRFFFVAGIMLLGLAAQSSAAIYSYRDEQGRLFLTDSPPNKKYKIVVTSRKEAEAPDSPTAGLNSITTSSKKFLLPSDDSFGEYINEAASIHGLDPFLIKSVIKVESDFDKNIVSSKGAQGLMQLMPATAKLVGCSNPFSARDNILGGSNYLRMMLKRFDGNIDYALAAYNAGPGNVEKYKGIPPFRETKNYVRKVNHYYQQYASSAGYTGKSNPTENKARIITTVHTDLNKRLTKAYEKFNSGDIDGAMNCYRDILNIYPRNTQALYNLACLLDMERCYDEAIDVYKASLKQDPFLDKALYNMAVIYERMGMNSEAIKTWKKYVKVTKDEDKIVMAEKFIKELTEYASLNR